MASTVRDFAIKITADTKELNSRVLKASTTITNMANRLKNVFGKVDKDIAKAAASINKSIQDIIGQMAKNTKEEIESVVDAVKQGGKQKANAHKEAVTKINKIEADAAKDRKAILKQQTQDAVRELKNQIKQLDKEAEQFGDLDVVKINKTQAIQDVQELGRVIKSSNKTTQEEIRIQLKRLDGQKISDIKDAEQKLKQILAQAQRNQAQAAKEAAKRRLQQANLTAEQRLEIAKKLQRQLQRIQEQGAARQQATRQTSARRQQQAPGERRTGRIGRGGALISEIGSSAQRATGSLGAFGQALGKLGPIGIAVGVGLAALVGTFLKAGEAAGKLGNEMAKVKTTINPEQFDELGGATQRLRDFSAQTGVELSELTDGMFNAASAVTAFKDDVNAGAEAVVIASRAAVGMSTDSGNLVSVMGDLANSFQIDASETENLNFIMDTVSQTFRDGKISGDELSSTIVKAAKSTSLLSADAKVGLTALNAMTASMTASGINAAETSTAINALQNEFLDLPKAAKLIEAGLGGISTEGGKVQVDFQELFESAGDDFEKYAQLLGSKQAKLAFRTLSGGGESAFLSISEGFNDVSGRSETAFNIMQDTSEAATKRLGSSFNELMISLGGSADSIITDVTNAAAGALAGLADLFKSAEQEAMESQENFNRAIETAAEIGTTIEEVDKALESLGPLSVGQVESEIQRIGEAANQFKDQFPLIAANIQSIINAEGEKTVGTLRILNEQLGRAQDLAQTEAFLEGFEGAAVGLDAIIEKIEDIGPLGKFAADQFSAPFGDGIGFINESLEGIDKRVNELFEEQQTLVLTNPEDVERMEELSNELTSLTDKQDQLGRARLATESGIKQFTETQLTQAQKLADSRGIAFNLDQQMLIIRNQLTTQFGKEGETLELINQLTNDRAETERTLAEEKAIASAKEVGDLQTVIDLENQKKQLKIDELNSQMQLLDMMGLLTEEQKTAIQSQIESLDVSKQAFGVSVDIADSLSEGLDLTEDQVSVNEDLADVLSEQVDLSDEKSFIDEAVNDLTSDILDNEMLTTDEKVAQLEELQMSLDTQIGILNAQLDQLQAEHDKQIAMAASNDLSAEAQDKALATAQAIREQIAALREEAAIAQSAATAIGGKITEASAAGRVQRVLGGGRRRSGGGGGRGRADRGDRDAERAEKDRQKAAEKAEKERQKAAERAQKEMQKRREEALKAAQELKEERLKREEEAHERRLDIIKRENAAQLQAIQKRLDEQKALESHTNALKLASDKIQSDLAKFSEDLAAQNRQFIQGSIGAIDKLLAPFKSEAQLLAESLSALRTEVKRSEEQIKADIAAKEAQISGEGLAPGEVGLEVQLAEKKDIIADLLTDADLARLSQAQSELAGVEVRIQQLDDAKDRQKEFNDLTAEINDLGLEIENLQVDLFNAAGASNQMSSATSEAEDELQSLESALSSYGSQSRNTVSASNALIDALKSMGIEVSGNKIKIDNSWKSFSGYQQQVDLSRQAIEAHTGATNNNTGATDTNAGSQRDIQNDISRTSNEINRLITERGNLGNVSSDIESLRNLEIQQVNLNTEIKELELSTDGFSDKLQDAQTSAGELEIQIEGLRQGIELLNEELQPEQIDDSLLSPGEAKQRIKELEATALGFSEVSKQLEKVITLQNQAFAAADPSAAIAKFNEADLVLKNMLADFELFGITIDSLVSTFGSLEQIDVEQLLDIAFGDAEDLTGTAKAERERAKTLLESALSFLKLQTELKEETIELNDNLEESAIHMKELEQEQQGLNQALSDASTFIDENNTAQLSATEELDTRYDSIIDNLAEQMRINHEMRIELQETNSTMNEQLRLLDTRIGAQRVLISQLRAQLMMEGLTEAQQVALNEQLAAANRLLGIYVTEQEGLQTKVNENKQELEGLTEEGENLNETMQGAADAFPEASEIAEVTEATQDLADAGDNVRDIFKAVGKAFEFGEGELALKGIIKGLDVIFQQFSQVAGLSEEVATGIFEVEGLFKTGRKAEAVVKGAELTTKIGQFLMNTGIGPLQAAGAVLLGVGLISKAVGKIVQAIKGREQTTLEVAEQRLATIERQNEGIRSQIGLMNDLAALGDMSVDTARERLAILEEEKEEFLKKNNLQDMSNEQLLKEIALMKERLALLDDFNDRLEDSKEFSNEEQRNLIEDVNEEFGTDFDFGKNVTKNDIQEVMDFVNEEIALGEGKLKNLELLSEFNQGILDEQFALLDERIKNAEFKIKLATEFEDPTLFLQSQEELISTLGEKLNGALEKAGVGAQLSELTKEELLGLRDEFDTLFEDGEVPESVISSWNALNDAIDSTNQKELEFVESQLENEKQMIELIRLREGAAKISTAEADEQVIKLLEEQIGIVNDQIDALGMSVELEMLLLGLQQELNALKAEENETDEESNRLLGISVRKRQELIETFRQEQKGGTLTGTQRQKLAQSEKEIVAQLKASGATQDDIDDFLRTLPAFETGGLVPETGAALVHEGELIIPANQVKEMEDQIRLFSQGIVSTNPIINGTDPLTQEFSRIILEREAQNINNNMINVNIGDIINNIPKTASDPEKIVAAINANIQSTIMGTVQRGIDQNKLDIRGKKT